MGAAARQPRIRILSRQPYLAVIRKSKPIRKHADYFDRNVRNRNLQSAEIARFMQMSFPIGITDKRDGSRSELLLFRSKQPPDHRLNAHYGKEVFRDMRSVNAICLFTN